MKKIIFLFLSITLFISNPVDAQSKKELKEQKKQEEYKSMKTLIQSGKYGFEATSCNTQKGRRIDLTSNGDSLIIEGSLVAADLPYFGEVQIANIGGDAGITFQNEKTEYEIEYNDKKYKIVIKFKASNKTEVFDAMLTVFGNGNSSLNITSSQRNYISYSGDVSAIKKPK